MLRQDGSLVGQAAEPPQFVANPDDVDRLTALFDELDRNRDGTISRTEIIKAMRTQSKVKPASRGVWRLTSWCRSWLSF